MRRAVSSFHNDTIASGHCSPARTVTSTNAAPDVARCKISAAETGSSSCASSTPITTSRPPERVRSSSPQRLISATMSSERTSSGTRSATAARGTAEALRVACTQSTNAPLRSAATCASLARRDFPTPASAIRTTPWQPMLARADAIASSSRSRPTSGHALCSVDEGPESPNMDVRSNVRPRSECDSHAHLIALTRTDRASPRRRRRPAGHEPARKSGFASRAPRPGLPTAARAQLRRRAPGS